MIKKFALYVFIFLFALVVFLLALMPASVLWKNAIEPNVNLNRFGVQVPSMEGTVWAGKALVQYQSLSSVIEWDVNPLGLVSLNLPIMLRIDSQAGQALVNAELGMMTQKAEIKKADIDLEPLNSLFRRQRVTLNGQLFVKNMQVLVSDKRISSASGVASWSGGEIAYPVQRSVHERDMPPFQLKVETKDNGEIYAGLRDSGGSMDVLEASLTPEGMAMAVVKRRILDLADEPWPSNSREQDTVFKVKKLIY